MPLTCACHQSRGTPCDYPNPKGCRSYGGCCDVPRCATCRRESTAIICDACVNRTTTQIAEVPSLLDRLAYATVTGGNGIVEFVSGGSFESAPPLSVDALSLLAFPPSAIQLELVDPRPPTREEGDSIPLWVTAWAAVWRQRWRHSQPAGVRSEPPQPASDLRPISLYEVDQELARAAEAAGLDRNVDIQEYGAAVAFALDAIKKRRAAKLAAHEAEHARRAAYHNRVVLGLSVVQVRDPAGEGGWRRMEYADDDPDTLAAHWAARFGTPRRIRRLMTDLAYLATWLPKGLAEFDDSDEFVLGLRALVGAARAAVGDQSDVIRLGQCPEMITDPATGNDEPCGAWLAKDAFATRVSCPRCKAETDEDGLLWLARRMREVYGSSADREAWTQ